jgi:hypothetical protein
MENPGLILKGRPLAAAYLGRMKGVHSTILILAGMLVAFWPAGAQAQATTVPSQSSAPDPGDYVPLCIESALGATEGLEVYVKRHDDQRALALLQRASAAQDECAEKYGANYRGRFIMLQTAADNYSSAADLAASLRKNGAAVAAARSANTAYGKLLDMMKWAAAAHWFGINGGENNIRANMQVNDDLIERLSH